MPLSTSQRAAVQQFSDFTRVDKKAAERTLKAHNWNSDAAAEAFFASQGSRPPASNAHATALSSLFDKYRDDKVNSPNTINLDGTQAYLGDLGIELDDIRVLILSTILQSPTLGQLDRDPFIAGWSAAKAPKIESQRAHLDTLCRALDTSAPLAAPVVVKSTTTAATSTELFTAVYRHTFDLALPAGSHVRAIDLDVAKAYWGLLLSPDTPGVKWSSPGAPWLAWWTDFLDTHWKKAVNRDLWNQTLLFARKTLADESLGFWSDMDAWPGIVDQFVEWAKKRRDGEVDRMETD